MLAVRITSITKIHKQCHDLKITITADQSPLKSVDRIAQCNTKKSTSTYKRWATLAASSLLETAGKYAVAATDPENADKNFETFIGEGYSVDGESYDERSKLDDYRKTSELALAGLGVDQETLANLPQEGWNYSSDETGKHIWTQRVATAVPNVFLKVERSQFTTPDGREAHGVTQSIQAGNPEGEGQMMRNS